MPRTSIVPLSLGLLTMVLICSSCGSSSTTYTGGPGFSEAFFDAAKLNAIMADAACVKIRFYNVRRTASDTKGSAMMIGIRSDGTEIFVDPTYKYRVYNLMSGTSTSTLDHLKPAAVAACGFIKTAGYDSYCGEFTTTSVASMLACVGCNGIRIAPALTIPGGLNTMKMWPVKIASGRATIQASPAPILCGEPCPSLCGSPANYVNS